ncbi:hypothetical protein [Aeromicrobium sp.]|uniref:hypothetical protein n=1 Tax=Aeromicrobium sp. TaxID=1871063 RepID=UPI002FCC13A9
MNGEADDTFGEALEARLRGTEMHVRSGPSEPAPSELDSLLNVADLLWETAHGAPPIASDPTAAMLGLVPDPKYALYSRALKRLRSNAQMKPSQLASQLRERGWRLETRDVVRWESRPSADVSPALIRAIAAALGAEPDELTSSASGATIGVSLTGLTASPKFARLAARWAAIQGISIPMARSALESRVVATVHRGEWPDDDQLLQSLEVLVDSVEESRGWNDDT